MSEQSRLRILCFGNPLHGDDGFGPAVALALRRLLATGSAEVIDCGNRGLDALHLFEHVRQVIVVDAMAGPRPGTVHLLGPRDVPVEDHHGGHGAGVGYLLAAVRETLSPPPRIDVIAAEIGPVGTFAPGLSVDVAAAVGQAVGLIRQRFLSAREDIAAELANELDMLREANQALEDELIQSTETMELLIAEQERQQDELRRRSEELSRLHGALERAIGTMAEIFVMLGPDGRVTRINPLLEQELGYTPASLIGAYFEDCLTAPSFQQLCSRLPVAQAPCLLHAIQAAGGRFSAELNFRRAGSGQPPDTDDAVPYLVRASLLHSQAGKLEGAVIVATNIAPLKSREQALRDNERLLRETAEELRNHRDNLARLVDERTHDLRLAMLQAEAASRAKSEFLSNMSHEVRTPLNAILGLSDLCLLTPLNPAQQQHIGKIRRAADHLLGIIDDILDFSRIEAGKLHIEQLNFELPSLLDEINDLLISRIEEKGLELSIDLAPEATRSFVGDPLRLKQVVINLLGNAIKFSARGCLQLACRLAGISGEQAELHFWIKDEGIGIAPEQQATLFSAFSQGDASTTRRYGGSGLGLAISKRLVELMGGRMWLESTPGLGSTFHFTVRFGCPPAALPATELRQQLAAYAGRSILIADDNPATREALGNLCRQLGFMVEPHASGDSALAALRRLEDPPLAALLDWQMPAPNGLDIIRELRRTALPGLPKLILLSSLIATSAAQADHQAADAVLFKPTSLHRLHAVLSKALGLDQPVPIAAGVSAPDLSSMQQLKAADILVVDDVELNRDLMRELFATAGIPIRLAGNGAEAIAMVRARKPDVILMDCQMPVMDGFTATRTLREMPEYADLPIIALTAGVLDSDREQCLAAGMNAHVSKPVDLERLLRLIADLLPAIPATPSPPSAPPAPVQQTAGAPPLPELPGINVADGLARVRHKVDFYRRMLLKFRDTNAAELARDLLQNVQRGQRLDAVRSAHSIKGVALSLGMTTLGETARTVELHLKEESTPVSEATIAPLLAEMDAVCAVLQALG
ncbi:MAG: hydrogenase maturation protease [Azonexus sp.]